MIKGDAGIGKTSLVKQFIKSVEHEIPAFYALPRPQTPFHPFREIISNIAELARRKGERVRQVWELLEKEVRTSEEDLPIRPGQMPDSKFRQINSLRGLFVEAARGLFPMIIVIDNLDEADFSTKTLFQAFDEMPEGTPLLVIGIACTQDALNQTSSTMRTFEIFVGPLSDMEVGTMLEAHLKSRVSEDLVQQVILHTASNPLRVTEFLHYAHETHNIFKDSATGEWTLSDTISETWKGLESLKEGFSDEEVSILSASAEISEGDFSLADILAVIGIDLETALITMKKAAENGIVEKLPAPNAFRFSHEHYRRFYADKLSQETVNMLHKNIGEILEKDPGTSPYLLAYHFAKSDDRNKALQYSMAAGQDAMNEDAFEHAQEFFTLALNFLQPSDNVKDMRVKLLENLGDCLTALLNFPEASESYAEALEAAPSSELTVARLRRKRASAFFNYGEAKFADNEAKSGLKALGMKIPSGTFSVTVSIIFHMLMVALIPINAFKHIKRSGSKNDKSRSNEILALLAVMEKISFFTDHRIGIIVHLKSLLLAAGSGEAEAMAGAFTNHGFICSTIGFHRRGDKFLSMAAETADKCSSRYWVGYCKWLSAASACAKGDFNLALKLSEEAQKIFKELKSPFELALVELEFFKNHCSLGNVAQAREHAIKNLEISRSVRDTQGESGALRVLGAIHTLLGEFNEAEALLDASLELAITTKQPLLEAATLRDVALLQLAKGQVEQAKTGFERSIQTVNQNDLMLGLFPDTFLGASEAELVLADKAKNENIRKERLKAAGKFLKKATKSFSGSQGDLYIAGKRIKARLFLARNNPKKALRFYLTSYKMACDIGQRLEQAATLLEMSKYANELGINESKEENLGKAFALLRELDINPDSFRPAFTTPERISNSSVIEEYSVNQVIKCMKVLVETSSKEEVFETLLEEAVSMCQANKAAIFLPSDNGGIHIPIVSRGFDDLWGMPEANYNQIIQPVISGNSPIVSEDALAYPVLASGTVAAVIYMEGFGPSRKISKSTLKALEAITCSASMAIAKVDAMPRSGEAVDEGREIQRKLPALKHGAFSPVPGMVGESTEIKEVYHLIEKAETSNASVFVTGETGTGKELVARALHEISPRRKGPFIPLNVGALPETLLESELFGHIKGAFTGATEDKDGLFVAANNGTLFMDEVEAMPPSLQTKLLRVLEERSVRPVGSTKMTSVDVRIVAASNEPMENLVEQGVFRSDLYYRLAVFPINIPPLRDRKSDIPALITHFLKMLAHELDKPMPPQLTPQAMDALMLYDFPGNIRELRNELERATLLARSGVIGLECFSSKVQNALGPKELNGKGSEDADQTVPKNLNIQKVLKKVEKKLITEALRQSDGNKSKAAGLLGISRQALNNKLKR